MSIREFFESEGEEAFRDVEQKVIAELAKNEGCVLSTGGGVVLRQTNRENLRLRCHAIYLHTVPQEVYKRLRHDRNRPLLQVADPLARLGELYAVRDPLYRESAQFVVETGRPSVSTLVYTILMQLELAGFVPAHR